MTGRDPVSGEVVEAALEIVRRRTGLVFSEPRRPAFLAALKAGIRRATVSPEAYLHSLGSDPAALDALIAEIVVGESYFLRDPMQWELLRTEILPAMLIRHPSRPLRIWSAGCSDGEEAYSVAITLHQLGEPTRGQVLGTDISLPALVRARRGEYSAWSLRNVPESVVDRYFRRRGRRFELVDEIKGGVEFRRLNLAEDDEASSAPYRFGAMDLILCRNVLIYLDADTVARVARRLLASLCEGGCLLLGASDPLIGGLVSCEVEVTDAGLIYRRKGGVRPEAVPSAPLPTAVARPVPRPAARDDLARIRACYAARDYESVVARAVAMVAAGVRSVEAEVLLVRALANRGDLAAAGQACGAALDVHRVSPELLYLHALLLSEAGRYTDSSDTLRRALYLDRRFVMAHLALGTVLTRLGETDNARRSFRTAARLLATIPDEPVPAADGEPAGRLADAARSQLHLLDRAVV